LLIPYAIVRPPIPEQSLENKYLQKLPSVFWAVLLVSPFANALNAKIDAN